MHDLRVRFRDPNRINLRKAARALLVVPAVFAAFVVAGDSSAALFAAFGSFAALVFADFGGPLPRRFRAYVGLALVGAVLDAAGTAVADRTGLAVTVTLVVVFLVTFAGALGGYFAAGGTAATLAFVLAVMTPGVEAGLWARELGWIVSVLLAGIGACVLWPVHQRDRVRLAAGSVLREAGAALAVPAATRDLGALRAADGELATRAGVVYRPAGDIARERALVALVVAARRLVRLLELVTAAELSPAADPTREYAQLAQTVSDTLLASARVVTREIRDDSRANALVDAREAHTTALERWAATVIPREGAASVIDVVAATFPLRRLSLATVVIAHDAEVVADDRVRGRADGEAELAAGRTVLRAHCNVRSVRFRNAARAGLGLALAVLVAKQTSVEHAFWVVLAALSVLRSNALGTGATALQALAGALVGLGVAAALMETVGGDDTWLWVLLPIVTFLAAYTPGAINFVVGQAAFTVFVVVLFNILVPEGWRTGLVRVQDIVIGAGIGVAVGALLWPRGARGVARRSFADLLRAAAARLAVSLAVALRGEDADLASAAHAVADARRRAVAALEDLAVEHGGGHVDRHGWSQILVDALLLELAAEGVVRSTAALATPAGPAACPEARDDLDAEGHRVLDRVERDAARLLRDGPGAARPPGPPRPDEPTRDHQSAPASLVACLDSQRPSQPHDGLALLWIEEWLALAAEHTSSTL